MTNTTIIASLSALISILSLGVAVSTMYFAWLRTGQLKMTTPTLVFFGYDSIPKTTPKIFLRTLLYSTAIKGKVIEEMYAKVSRDGEEETFGTWGYGEANNLVRGSGLYVGQTGVAAYHHFVLSLHHPGYDFSAGTYTIQVFARLAGKGTPVKLSQITINLNTQFEAALSNKNGVMLEWDQNSQSYVGHTNDRIRNV